MHQEPPHSVTAAEITRNFGMWQDRAVHGPLVVTHHGRPRVMIVAVDHYEALAAGHGLPAGAEELEAARLSVVLGQIGGAFAAFDTELRFTRLNTAAIAYFGQPGERLIGRTPEEAFAGREAMIAGHVREVLRTGEEMQVDLPAGVHGERMLRIRLFPYPGGVAMLFRNVADMRHAEHTERERIAQAQARRVHGGVGAGRLGPRATFEHVEPPLAGMAGFAAERLNGVRFADLLSLPSRAAASEAIEQVLTGQGERAFDSVMLVNGGGELPVRVALAELREGFAISGAAVMVTQR